MKAFIKKTLLFALIFALIAVSVCVYIDPYNVFHALSYRENGVEPNKNYMKMRYVLREPEKFDTFLFGSSRVGFLNAQKLDGVRAYNMSYSLGLPQEHLANIRTLLKKGVVPKHIILEIDDVCYRFSPESHKTEHSRAPYEYLTTHPLGFAELYLCPVVALDAVEIIRYSDRNAAEEEAFYAYGSRIVYGEQGKYSPKTETEDLSGPSYMDEAMDTMRALCALCRDNGIELTVLVTPLHYATYTGALERGDYYTFLRRLAEITPYYNFSGFNDITTDDRNYMDTSHYLAEIGDIMIDAFWHGKTEEKLLAQGFGYYTDGTNVEQLIEILENGRIQYQENGYV